MVSCLMKNIFKTFRAAASDIALYFWPWSNRTKLIRSLVLVVILIAGGFFLTAKDENTDNEAKTTIPIVYVGDISDVTGNSSTSFVGNVRAVNEATIQAEVGGRVTSVRVKAGDTVSAGEILATLENASEQAAVLQAEGAYEAALAAASQADVSVSSAENTLNTAQNSAISTYRAAYNTTNAAVINTIDQFFSVPQSATPGVRINTKTSYNASFLNSSRVELQSVLPNWNSEVNTLNNSDNLTLKLTEAKVRVNLVVRMLDVLIDITSRAEVNETLDGAAVTSYTTGLTTARANLNSTLSSLDTSISGLRSANEELNRARISGTEAEISTANAQVKQALGSLRSAQANLAKTILRSPISGVVNSINLNVGDYVSAMTPVAEVANNDALEITVYVSEKEVVNLKVGEEVELSNGETGTITNIAPAIDPVTLKIPVKVAVESTDILNNDTISVRLATGNIEADANVTLLVPLTAVKFQATDGIMFTVSQENKLVANPVSLGDVRGSFVEVISGIDSTTKFVIDARGLSVGQTVEAQSK